MSSVGEAVVEGGLATVGFVVGGWFGAPGLGASIGYQVGDGLWSLNQNGNSGSSGGSSVAGLGPVDLTKSHRLPVPVIYGEHLVSGNVIYQDAYGDDSPKLDMQVAVSEGPIDSISSVKVNDFDLGASNYSTRLGNRSQSPTSMNPEANHAFTAYIAASLNAEEMELSGTPTLTSIVRGREIEVYDGSSWVTQYSNNPAYVLLDFLTNDRYGLGIDDSQIDKDSFIAVANWCDETVNGGPRYTLNTVLDRQASSLDIIQKMLQTFQSFLVYSGGELRLKADTVEDSVAQTFDEDNIVQGSFSYQQVAGDEVPNTIHAEYVEPDEGWQMVKATYENDTDIRNRGKRIEENLQLTGVTNFDQAGRITRVFHNQLYYNQYMASWEAGIDSLHCEPGDVVELSHSLTGWNNKKFRIMQIKEKENDQLQIMAREYNEQVFTDEGVDYQPPEGPTLPNPAEPPPHVESVSAVEVKHNAKDATAYSTVELDWDRPTDYPFYQRCNIYAKRGSESTYPDSPIAEVKGTSWETDQFDTDTYDFKFVTVNRNGIEAEFSSAPTVTLTVEGKTTHPDDVSFVAGRFQNTIFLNWNPVPDEDLDYYEIRTDLDWGNTTDALVDRRKAEQIQIDEFPVGDQTAGTRSYTFYIKAKNNSGLYSQNYDSITVENPAPDPPTLNITEFFEKLWIEITPPSGDGTINGYEVEVDGTVFDISVGERLSYNAKVATEYDIRARSYDVIGSGDWSAVYTASTKDIDSVAQYASSLRPAEIVETLPSLPNDDYPPGTWVTKITKDGSGNITDVELYENVSDSWDGPKKPDFSVGDAVWPRVIAGTIQAGAISSDEIAANAVRAEEIAADTITATEIAGKTITADEIASGTITAGEIDANTITANEIAAGTITATEIDANTITADQIASGTITANEIDADTITANELDTGSVTTDEISVSNLADIANLSVANGDIEIGYNVLDSGYDGIHLEDGSGDTRVEIGELSSGTYGMEVTDNEGDVIFNSDGVFTGFIKNFEGDSEIGTYTSGTYTIDLTLSENGGLRAARYLCMFYLHDSSGNAGKYSVTPNPPAGYSYVALIQNVEYASSVNTINLTSNGGGFVFSRTASDGKVELEVINNSGGADFELITAIPLE